MAQTTTNKVKIDAKSVIEELKTPGLIILGIIGGSMTGKMIDKVIKVDETKTGFDVKKMVKPLVQITAGVGGAIFLKDKNLKLVASGVAATGIASSVKVFLKKDLLQGISQFAGLGNSQEQSYTQVFKEPLNLEIAPYNPKLPILTGGQELIEIPIETEEVSGVDLGAYQEIKEVEIL